MSFHIFTEQFYILKLFDESEQQKGRLVHEFVHNYILNARYENYWALVKTLHYAFGHYLFSNNTDIHDNSYYDCS